MGGFDTATHAVKLLSFSITLYLLTKYSPGFVVVGSRAVAAATVNLFCMSTPLRPVLACSVVVVGEVCADLGVGETESGWGSCCRAQEVFVGGGGCSGNGNGGGRGGGNQLAEGGSFAGGGSPTTSSARLM